MLRKLHERQKIKFKKQANIVEQTEIVNEGLKRKEKELKIR
jgi:hypothetical protein